MCERCNDQLEARGRLECPICRQLVSERCPLILRSSESCEYDEWPVEGIRGGPGPNGLYQLEWSTGEVTMESEDYLQRELPELFEEYLQANVTRSQ